MSQRHYRLSSDSSKLTNREQQVMVLMLKADDTSDKGLARLLHVSRKTIDAHLTNVRRKLGVRTRTAALIRFATQTIL